MVFWGLKRNIEGELSSLVSPRDALMYTYLDPQVTNCYASWFCSAGTVVAIRDMPILLVLNMDTLTLQTFMVETSTLSSVKMPFIRLFRMGNLYSQKSFLRTISLIEFHVSATLVGSPKP